MANIKITDAEYRGDLIISCKMDGVPVQLIDRSWDVDDILELAARGGGGAVILAAFFPGGFAVGAIIGALSKFLSMDTGYYNRYKECVRAGNLYRDDLF